MHFPADAGTAELPGRCYHTWTNLLGGHRSLVGGSDVIRSTDQASVVWVTSFDFLLPVSSQHYHIALSHWYLRRDLQDLGPP